MQTTQNSQNSKNPKNSKNIPLHIKWSQKRILRDENTPYTDPGIDFSDDPGLTDQSQSKEADVNNVVARYIQTGQLPQSMKTPRYDDLVDAPDYHTAMTVVANAQQQFDALDARIRAQFSNDPAQFLEFAQNPANASTLIDLGLATSRPQADADRIIEAIRSSNANLKPHPSKADPAAGNSSPT